MMKKMLNTLFIIIGIIGIIMALMSIMASMMLGGTDTFYDSITLFLGAVELVGSVIALIMSLRLKRESAVKTGIVFLLLGSAFAASGYLFMAPINILPVGLCILSGSICFWRRKF